MNPTDETPTFSSSTATFGLYQRFTPIPLPPLLEYHVNRDEEFAEVLIGFLKSIEDQIRADFTSAHGAQREVHDLRLLLHTYPYVDASHLRLKSFACDRGVEPPKRISEVISDEAVALKEINYSMGYDSPDTDR